MITMKKTIQGRSLLAVLATLLLLQQVHGVKQQEENETVYDLKTTLPIQEDEEHRNCQLLAGFNLTMIHCDDQFEVYDTQSLEKQESLITDFGFKRRKITGVHNSLQSKDRESITFMDYSKVFRLYRDITEPITMQVKLQMVMDLDILIGTTATDVFVLDGMIIARIDDLNFSFFVEPLVISQLVQATPMAIIEDEDDQFDFSTLVSYDFAPNNHAQSYTLYGVTNTEQVKIVFTYERDLEAMSQKVTRIDDSLLSQQVRIKVTDQFVIVADSQSVSPGVAFYDYQWVPIKFFYLDSSLAPYNIEFHPVPTFPEMLQVFIAGSEKVYIIEQVKDEDGDHVF